ncbi:TrbC/VirB2 family protein [Caulobacter segnis]|uniref:TrbC/VirB2 family protein n=1 Tax=Caulobacter segnis TaxID=88688 RepID=UPI00240EE079|nr:TrbC/VirB2 family protein [Caulobacter segnis]MDG2520517.1 TrbC/VirB2 family protein [Caulobacter segnis]
MPIRTNGVRSSPTFPKVDGRSRQNSWQSSRRPTDPIDDVLIKRRSFVVRSHRHLAIVCLALSSLSGPAFAQSAGGDLGGFIQNIIDLLNSDIIRGLAVLAVILTGVAWMFGQIDLRRAGTVVVGIIVIFGAGTIVDMIVGGA